MSSANVKITHGLMRLVAVLAGGIFALIGVAAFVEEGDLLLLLGCTATAGFMIWRSFAISLRITPEHVVVVNEIRTYVIPRGDVVSLTCELSGNGQHVVQINTTRGGTKVLATARHTKSGNQAQLDRLAATLCVPVV